MTETYKLITYITLAGLIISGTLYYSNNRDLCSDNALWTPTGIDSEYYCPSEEKTLFCWKLSSSRRTCYIAHFKVSEFGILEIEANGKKYRCEGKGDYSRCKTSEGIEGYYGELS